MKVVCLMACLMMVGAVAAQAATINVPADQPTIQAAVDAAAPGDTIQVAPGIYPESVDVNKSLWSAPIL